MDLRKVIIFSTLISLNIVIWHEILGTEFLHLVLAVILLLLFIVGEK
ncbi:MAG: hypothetical protein KKD29_07175 [Candidatus Omnitrophica bacterium]|nr:hypothetical protein [Candidatus Omnitrophota bacterium]MBU4488257.1 hypothetical protein [Candidatus Omnitrophota bacterium]